MNKPKNNPSPATVAGMIQNAADVFPQALFLLDRQHKIILANNAAQKLTGLDTTNLIGQDIKLILALEEPRTQQNILKLKLPSNQLFSLQARIHAVPYNVSFLPLSYIPYFNAFKPRPFTLAIVNPQTSNHVRESTSTTVYLEVLGQLTMRIAHDFSNSLTSIMGNAELLAEQLSALQNTAPGENLSDPIEQALPEIHDIIRKSNEMSQLIQTLQTYATQPPSSAYVLDVNTAIRETIAMARGLLGRKIQIEFLPSENLPQIYMDRLRIDQILLSILISSKSKMPTGGRITIETDENQLDSEFVAQHAGSSEGHFTRLSITDSSKGIAPEELPHIFELPTSTDRNITNLSLPTVYAILKQSRGYINVANWHGKGTRFDIYIPQTPPTQASTIETDEVPVLKLQPTPPELQQPKTISTNRLILLAEDDPEIQRSIQRAAMRENYEIIITSNGHDALERYKSLTLKKQQPALLIADYGLPGIDGRTLCTTIKTQFAGANVLLTSGYRIEVDQVTNQTADGLDFLPKPFTPAILLKRISNILSKANP
jgi:two-component system, cell cycle sensor histidine kinase and response regulator CckA